MKLHVNKEFWKIEDVCGIKGASFSIVAKFTLLEFGKTFVYPLISKDSEIWQVEKDEFVILSGNELVHIKLQFGSGIIMLFKTHAETAKSLLNRNFFYFEVAASVGHIYSVHDHLELKMILKNMIDPDVDVTILKESEAHPMLVQIEAPYLSAQFLLRKSVGSLKLYSCDNKRIENFKGFTELAKNRCNEARLANYYEKCGGYSIDGKSTIGIFTEKIYGGGSTIYEFSPDDFFSKNVVPKLLLANNLVEVTTNRVCSFLGKSINTPEFSIELSSDVLIITEYTDSGDKFYALEMTGETCLGIRQIGEKDFLAVNAKNSSNSLIEIKRFFKQATVDKYAWDPLPSSHLDKHAMATIFCQLTDDILVYSSDYANGDGCKNLEMWSISQKQLVNVSDSFVNLYRSKNIPSVYHMEKQILVKPVGKKNASKDPQIMIALRLYQPKEYCDVYALINPNKEYHVYGKVYNMLADSIISKPRTINGLLKLFEENKTLKQKYSL